ncbi:MAG: hypothetical protein PSV16_00610 [Flavobacterium sp.]|nr:hypothetical protein [Flavobacterium sp.]
MRKFLIINFVLFAMSMNAQRKSYDFIIMVDEEIIPSMTNARLVINKSKEIPIQYYPGNLSISLTDSELLESNIGEIILKFSTNDYSGKEQRVNNYEIEVGKNWFEKSYIILRIYNTYKKKYKKEFEPLKGKDYTFELEYAGGQMLQVRKHK